MTETTYGAAQSSIQGVSADDNLIKEDDGNEEEEYLYGHDNEEVTKTQALNTVSAG